MVLKVINGKKERHDSAQAQIDGFNGVVMLLNGAPHLKDSYDVQNETPYCRKPKNEKDWRRFALVSRYAGSHEDSTKAHHPGTNSSDKESHEIALLVELFYKPSLYKEPYQREKPAEPTDQEHERPVQVRWGWIPIIDLGRGSRSAVDRPTGVHRGCGHGHGCRSGHGRRRRLGWNVANDLGKRQPVRHALTAGQVRKQNAALSYIALEVGEGIGAVLIELPLNVILHSSPLIVCCIPPANLLRDSRHHAPAHQL